MPTRMMRNNRARATATSTSTPRAREPHFDDREQLRMVAQDEREQRVRFRGAAHDQRDRQERVGDAEQQDHQRQEQQIRLVPVDRQVLLVGAAAARGVAA